MHKQVEQQSMFLSQIKKLKKGIMKAAREKQTITYKGSPIYDQISHRKLRRPENSGL